MVRFGLITMSFAVMGVTFYEMSGGDDFDGEALRLSRIDTQELPAQTAPETAVAIAEPAAPSGNDVTRVALNLTTLSDVIDPAPAPAQAVPTPVSVTTEEVITSGIVLPSLIPGAAPQGSDISGVSVAVVDLANDTAVAAGTAPVDLRSVTGSRVNVRGGPGTDFSVVDSLTLGAEVEVLEDPGNGWVRLRPVGGGPVGWMADFLLTDAS